MKALGAILLAGMVCSAPGRVAWADPVPNAVLTGSLLLQAATGYHGYYDEYGVFRSEATFDDVSLAAQFNRSFTSTASGAITAPCVLTEAGDLACLPEALSYETQSIGRVSVSGGTTPQLSMTGQADNANANGNVSLTYFIRLDKLALDAPDDVWININLSGTALLFAGDSPSEVEHVIYTQAFARAYVSYLGPGESIPTALLDQRVWNSSDPNFVEPGFNTDESLQPGQTAQVVMSIWGTAAGTLGRGGLFQARLDPLIRIDPDGTVSYGGQDVPAASLYSIAFSPELAPEPSSPLLSGAALGVIGVAASRRRKPGHRWAPSRPPGSARPSASRPTP